MMQVEIKIDKSCKESKIIILTNRITDEVDELIKKLSDTRPQTIAGFRDGTLKILAHDNIVRIFAANRKIYAQTEKSEYLLRLRLYELEERLDKNTFVRISKSEIINLRKVENMDLNFSGTICVKLCGNITTFVSRRYVSKIKKVLGI
ncbi:MULTISPECIES: LytTR family DNA-binding domain-containing protein [Clostridium]|jgi:DNA-binding LytR/AlgR family response regulator|uniref:LytTR family DNA-binding domain-containing protein n=1 Tax=Clostridium lapidicellarium TaxID=3240931 RepID=A0ABV4DZJ4_9CLOT